MKKRKICIIDDQLPASGYPTFINETGLIDQSALKYLTYEHMDWPEPPLQNLVSRILEDEGNWSVTAFLNPEFYFNHKEVEIYNSEIIILDWDFGASSETTDVHLLRMLKSTYAIIGIYTGAEQDGEIDAILSKKQFEPYLKERIRKVPKGEENAVDKILEEVNGKFESHFSFKLGQELKYNAIKALDSILSDIGKMSFDEFIWTFGHEKDEKERAITINEFIEILSEKFKNNLANADWSETSFDCSEQQTNVSEELVRKLWSYRLYKSLNDDLVRVGDIISKEGSSTDEKFLVISSDCHMDQLWKKNFGSMTLIPLYANTKTSGVFQDRLLTAQKRGNARKAGATSMVNKLAGFDSLTLITSIPSLKDDGTLEFTDYVAFPRSVFSIDVPKPAIEEHQIRVQALHYSHIAGFNGKGRLSINEPFRSPLIQYCVNAVTGYGAPDYPNELQISIQKRFDENFKA